MGYLNLFNPQLFQVSKDCRGNSGVEAYLELSWVHHLPIPSGKELSKHPVQIVGLQSLQAINETVRICGEN